MRRMTGGSSFQSKCLEHMAAQTEAQQRIASELGRIATALEQRQS